MKRISLDDARELVLGSVDKNFEGIPPGFKPDMIPFLFPINERPAHVYVNTPPISPEQSTRTSVRRDEDEARRKAMHALVTGWDQAAKITARRLVEVLFRGLPCGSPAAIPCELTGRLEKMDYGNVSKFLSLIPDCQVSADSVVAEFAGNEENRQRWQPVFRIGGYSVTETVGPLSMLSRVCKSREQVIIWVKEKMKLSHGKRKLQISHRTGRIVLFDRYLNVVFVPAGNAADNWQFIRGHVILLVQRR